MSYNLSVSGDTLTITVNLKEVQGPSSTGKSTIVASTNGFVALPNSDGKTKLSMNLIRADK